MDLRQIRYFVALFEECSVTRAARRLGVVQPALSMQIRKLEDEFQTQLFDRTSRGVEPTESARALHARCVSILASIEDARQFLRESSGQVTGEVAIGLMPSVAASAMASTVMSFNSAFPAVRLKVIEAYSDDLIERLSGGAIDLAVINDSDTLGLGRVPLFSDRLVLVSRGEPDQGSMAGAIPAAEIGRYRLVLPSARQGMRRLVDDMLGRAGHDLAPALEIDSLNTVLDLVGQSDLATVLPGLAAYRAAAAGLVRVRLIVEPEIKRDIIVAYNGQRPPTRAGRYLVEHLSRALETFGQQLDLTFPE